MKHLDFYTSYDEFPNDSENRINYLMKFYGWSRLEASSYFYYEPFDENDWVDYE
jgi:hypothetical protein